MSTSNFDPQTAISGYVDDILTEAEHAALSDWLKADAANAKQFAAAMLLHDRLRIEQTTERAAIFASGEVPLAAPTVGTVTSPARRRILQTIATLTSAVLVILAFFWYGLGETRAVALEINRLIDVNEHSPDRTYRIDVEERREATELELPLDAPERTRPTKTPIDRAILHVRGGGQFVLIRETEGKRRIITGCNGRSSWIVRPNGTTKVSDDPIEFQRDVPGHEHQMPLININIGLSRLLAAYDVHMSSVEDADSSDPTRLIVAVKKRGVRGPKRVEISYATRNGSIRQMRFIDMPFGPEKLTLRMSLLEERPLDADFFDLTSRHVEAQND